MHALYVQNFRTDDAEEQLLTFWKPIKGDIFRFHINDGEPADDSEDGVTHCWNIRLYGYEVTVGK